MKHANAIISLDSTSSDILGHVSCSDPQGVAARHAAPGERAPAETPADSPTGGKAYPTKKNATPKDVEEVRQLAVRSPVSAWRIEDRPAEKLLRRGARACTDAELLSLLIPRGTRQGGQLLTRLDIARLLVRRYGSLEVALARNPLELAGTPGIGRQVAARLSAASEIARRIESQRGHGERIRVGSPADVAATYGPLMRDLRREVFKVVLLNTANVIISDFDASVGGLAASIVEPRAVFRQAILESAAAVICLHNHPSQNPEPSRQDIRITRQLIEAGKLMGIPLHDHVIIAGAAYTSLAERGLLNS